MLLVISSCGMNNAGQEIVQNGSIRKGVSVSQSKYPWHVLIVFGAFCNGAILDKRTILTAAHCIPENNIIDVYTGEGKHLDGRIKIAEAKSVIIHPEYAEDRDENDLAIIKTKEDIVFSASVGPIKLASKSDEKKAKLSYFLTGWGRNETQVISDALQEIELFRLSALIDESLEPIVIQVNGQTINRDSIIRFKVPYPAGICNGDSGGPLIMKDSITGEMLLIGITISIEPGSADGKCSNDKEDGLAFFVSIPNYSSWILSHLTSAESLK